MADMDSQWKTPEWKTPAFRQKIVAQIDEAIRQSGNPINKNSVEMESHVFNKAKTKDEYLSFVARLILHVREMSYPRGGRIAIFNWAMVVGHICETNSWHVLVSWLPTYFQETFPSAKASSLFSKALFLGLAGMSQDFPTSVTFLTLGVAVSGLHSSGILANPQDLAPRHAGVVFGIMNMDGSIPGLLVVYVASYVLSMTNSWAAVFNLTAIINVICGLLYVIYGLDSSNKQANQGPPNPNGMPLGTSPNPDPINALQSMARQEGSLTYFPGTANMQLSQALSNHSSHLSSALVSSNLGVPMPNQPPPGAAAAAGAIAQVAGMSMGVGHPGQVPQPQSLPQGNFQGMVSGMSGQQRGPMGPNSAMSNMVMAKALKTQQAAQVKTMQAMQQGQLQQPPNMPPPIKPGTPLGGSLPPGLNDALMHHREPPQPGAMNQFVPQNSPQIPRQGTPTPFLRQSPGPVQVSSHSGMVPSPAQQMPSLSSSQMTPSPAGYMPSQSPQIIPSPVGIPSVGSQSAVRTPGTAGAPSPGSVLNTPMGSMASPISRNQEDQVYLEKVKQLSKYIDPLRRMIARIDKDEDKKKELSKMKNLLDILSNPSKRLPMDTLLKCEQFLEKMELKVKSSDPSLMIGTGSMPQSGLPNKEYNICQPLYDAICAHISLPTFSHTLQRTFGPAVATLHGERIRKSPPLKKKKFEDDAPDVPDILQGEIARLDRRFKVTLNPIQHGGSRTVHLICQLDDKNLPCVPPITVTVPESYPQQAPLCDASSKDYESTQFLQTIHTNLLARISKMPDQFSITSLLDTWEMSVRQACAPISTVTLITS